MTIGLEDQIGEIVADDYRTAEVFRANGIDFCCRGHRTLQDALNEKGLSADDIIKELATSKIVLTDTPVDYSTWKLDKLIDHIISKHHTYIKQQIPVINGYLDQVFKAHSKTHPVIVDIRRLFTEDAKDLLQHLEAEEDIVFPMIRDLAVTPLETASPSCVPFNFFQQMISAMEYDHLNVEERWKKIVALTDNYELQFGCTVAYVAFSLMEEYYENKKHNKNAY